MITILLMALSAAASPATGAHAAAARQEPLDEIVVKGARTELIEIRQQMVDLEDRFYGRYNELMPNDLFDIHCDERALTGTAVRRRYCRAGFERRAFETEGQQHLLALQYQAGNSAISPMEWIAPAPPIIAIERQRKDFRQAMLQVTRDNPELVELLRQRAELAERYEKLRRDIFGHRPAP